MALSSVDGPSAEPDSSLDTSPFSDVAKRGLVDALYSVCDVGKDLLCSKC